MAKSKSKSKSKNRSRKSPRKFLLKKGSRCPTGYIRTVQVKKSSKKYGTRLPSYCVEFPEVENFKRRRRTKSKSKSKPLRRKSSVRAKLMGFDGISYRLSSKKSKGSKKGSRKYKFIGIDDKN